MFDPSNVLHSSQGFFQTNLVDLGYSYTIWPVVYPRWPLHDLWPLCSCEGFFWPNLVARHRAFVRQLDLWMSFDLWWDRFETMLSNLEGLPPIPMPSFSSVLQSMMKRTAGHRPTCIHTDPIILVVLVKKGENIWNRVLHQGLSLDSSCPTFWQVFSVPDRQKLTILDHFIQFYPILDHFIPFYPILDHFGWALNDGQLLNPSEGPGLQPELSIS